MESYIVAVAIYYYRFSEGILGGDIEFVEKVQDSYIIPDSDRNQKFVPDKSRLDKFMKELPRVKVPIGEGTLVVFSNYQLIHRVLKMVYSSNMKGDQNAPYGFASRDFLVFFIVNQGNPLMSCKEIKDDVMDEEKQKNLRKVLFDEQIMPSGYFGGRIVSTGNTWEDQSEDNGWIESESLHPEYDYLNICPETLGRGISEPLSYRDSFVKFQNLIKDLNYENKGFKWREIFKLLIEKIDDINKLPLDDSLNSLTYLDYIKNSIVKNRLYLLNAFRNDDFCELFLTLKKELWIQILFKFVQIKFYRPIYFLLNYNMKNNNKYQILNCKNPNNGNTLLMECLQYNQGVIKKFIKFLLGHGIDITIENDQNESAKNNPKFLKVKETL